MAMSTFSPVGSQSSNDTRMCVCVCVCMRACVCVYVYGMNLKYALCWHIHIIMSSFRTVPVLYTSTRTHASSNHSRTPNRRGSKWLLPNKFMSRQTYEHVPKGAA